MAAEYTMQEVEDLNQEGKRLTYPRMIIKEQCGTDELVSFAAKHTTYPPAELKGALEVLRSGLVWMMADGRSVKLEGIGTFTPGLTLKPGAEREEPDGSGTKRNAASIRVGSVRFRPDKQLIADVDASCRLVRSRQKFARQVSPYTPEERLAMAQRYLETNPWLHIDTYATLTGLSRTTAGRELRRWSDTPGSGIGTYGGRTRRVYVKRTED